MEYVEGGILYDIVELLGGLGEDAGRFFLKQIIESLGDYMHEKKGVVHRDLKLENILIDSNLNVKICDFGFATYKKTNQLQSYLGS